jgi:valyl-tRNA synthetase
MPHVTEAIYQHLFRADASTFASIHTSAWPQARQALIDEQAERAGEALIAIGAAVRRFKTDLRLGLGTPLGQVTIAAEDAALRIALEQSQADLTSLTRAGRVAIVGVPAPGMQELGAGLAIAIETL